MRRWRPNPPIPTGVLFFVLCAIALPASAGKKKDEHEHIPQASPAWNLRFKSFVQWQKTTSLGNLVVCTDTALNGVDPARGRVVWTHARFGRHPEDGYDEIDGTPLIVLSGGRAGSSAVVLDSIDGRVVFDSAKAGLTSVIEHHVLPLAHGLLVAGHRGEAGARSLMFVDIEKGQPLWVHGKLLGAADESGPDVESGLTAPPLEISADTVLVSTKDAVYSLDTRSGRAHWAVRQPKGALRTRLIRAPGDAGVLYIDTAVRKEGSSKPVPEHSLFGAYRLADGKSVWGGLIRLPGGLNDASFHGDRLLLSAHSKQPGSVRMVQAATGRTIWQAGGAESAFAGRVVEHVHTDGGVVVLMDPGGDGAAKAPADEKRKDGKKKKDVDEPKDPNKKSKLSWLTGWMKRGESDREYLLDVLDPATGGRRLKDPLKVEGRLVAAEAIEAGILFVTTSDLNVVDPASGSLAVKKPIRSKASLITADAGDSLLAFSSDEGALYRLDRASGKIKKISDKSVKLEWDDTPAALEVEGERIVLLASQNVATFGSDGKLRFHEHQGPPEDPAWREPLFRAQSVRSALAAVAAWTAVRDAVARVADRGWRGPGGEVAAALTSRYARTSSESSRFPASYAQAARARAQVSTAARNHTYMMVQLEDEHYGLLKISKENGRRLRMIRLGRTKRPIYAVDAVWDQVYTRPNPYEIAAYKF